MKKSNHLLVIIAALILSFAAPAIARACDPESDWPTYYNCLLSQYVMMQNMQNQLFQTQQAVVQNQYQYQQIQTNQQAQQIQQSLVGTYSCPYSFSCTSCSDGSSPISYSLAGTPNWPANSACYGH